MAKNFITIKELKKRYQNIITIPYINLLDYLTASYYHAGKLGWNFDAYVIDNETVVISGDRPFKTTKITYEKAEALNDEFMNYKKNVLNYMDRKNKANELINSLVSEVIKK